MNQYYDDPIRFVAYLASVTAGMATVDPYRAPAYVLIGLCALAAAAVIWA